MSRIRSKITIALVLSVSLAAPGCAMSQKKRLSEVDHAQRLTCATAEGDIPVLKSRLHSPPMDL